MCREKNMTFKNGRVFSFILVESQTSLVYPCTYLFWFDCEKQFRSSKSHQNPS